MFHVEWCIRLTASSGVLQLYSIPPIAFPSHYTDIYPLSINTYIDIYINIYTRTASKIPGINSMEKKHWDVVADSIAGTRIREYANTRIREYVNM